MTSSRAGTAQDFASLFGRPSTVVAVAHGRVNLIGEHTDYNDGFVLPTLIPQSTRVELAPRDDGQARVFSTRKATEGIVSYRVGGEMPTKGWLDYVQGVTHVLGGAAFTIRGFDALIDSDVPLGSGVSSSAALEVAMLRAVRDAFSLELDDVRLAMLARQAENEFVGAPVGIMDQMCSSLADERSALLLDCRSLTFERVPLPEGADLIVINSGVAHRLQAGDSGYATRRQQCEEAARLLGVASLRDVTADDLPRALELDEPLGRRVQHVVTENARVLDAAAAMRNGDLVELGRLFAESHVSMRDDYEVSASEVDQLVTIATADDAVFGARMTGGGFGGSIVACARKGDGRAAARRIAASYGEQSGQTPTVLVPAGL